MNKAIKALCQHGFKHIADLIEHESNDWRNGLGKKKALAGKAIPDQSA